MRLMKNLLSNVKLLILGDRSQKPSSWILALDLLANGKIDTDKMITKVYGLDDWREAFEAVMAGNEIKVLVKS